MGYPTPSNLPTERICRQIFIPDDARWLAVYNGLLSYLAQPFAWEQIGSLTPDECAAVAADIFYQFLEGCGGSPVNNQIGQIVMFIGKEIPANYLAPGNGYSIEQFPILASMMPDDLVFPEAGIFGIPPISDYALVVGNGNVYGETNGNLYTTGDLGLAYQEYNTGATYLNLWVVGDPQ